MKDTLILASVKSLQTPFSTKRTRLGIKPAPTLQKKKKIILFNLLMNPGVNYSLKKSCPRLQIFFMFMKILLKKLTL